MRIHALEYFPLPSGSRCVLGRSAYLEPAARPSTWLSRALQEGPLKTVKSTITRLFASLQKAWQESVYTKPGKVVTILVMLVIQSIQSGVSCTGQQCWSGTVVSGAQRKYTSERLRARINLQWRVTLSGYQCTCLLYTSDAADE